MTIRLLLAAAVLACASPAVLAGKAGVPGAGTSGSGGVLGNQALDDALGGSSPIDIPGGQQLYARLRALPPTIVLEDGSVVSPDTRLPDGRTVVLTVAPDGEVRNVRVLDRDPPGEGVGGSCGS